MNDKFNIKKNESILDKEYQIKFNGKKILLLIVYLILFVQVIICFKSSLNFDKINTFFTFVLVLSTIMYTSLTNSLVNETLKMRELQSSPNIILYFQSHSDHFNVIELIIENIGNGSAHNINFLISDSNKESSKEYKFLSNLNLINKGIRLLASKQKIKTFVTSMFENFEEKKDMFFIFDIKFNDFEGNKFEQQQKIDFSELIGLRTIGESNSYSISKNLNKIATVFDRIVSSNKLSVNTFDATDRNNERAEIEQEVERASQIFESEKNKKYSFEPLLNTNLSNDVSEKKQDKSIEKKKISLRNKTCISNIIIKRRKH